MPLVGIARLASISPLLDAKRAVTYQHLPTRNWITHCAATRMPFEWTINPYRGCEFGCKYCYARYTHEFMEMRDPDDFEFRIFAKQFSRSAFCRELAKIDRRQHIAIGTATDPYQPAERRYGLTRSMLEVLAEEHGRKFSMVTKSDLVARDAALLARIAKANVLHVNITITTVDTDLARKLEPRAPRPDLRLNALRELIDHGVPAGVFSMPVLPGITDSVEKLRGVARAASAAGARYHVGGVVFLRPCARQVFMPFLEQEFPHLVPKYQELFGRNDYLRGEYPSMIQRRMEAIRAEFGLARGPMDYQPEEDWEPQLSLFP
jgi:DNA repair photolyase